ncbi:MAG: hypothetical protein R3Y54_12605 [Eubacteriales bacterium]
MEDIDRWGNRTNVTIENMPNLNQEDLIKLLNDSSNNKIVLGWCFSERNVNIINAIKSILN